MENGRVSGEELEEHRNVGWKVSVEAGLERPLRICDIFIIGPIACRAGDAAASGFYRCVLHAQSQCSRPRSRGGAAALGFPETLYLEYRKQIAVPK
jgi:hypothetical protein